VAQAQVVWVHTGVDRLQVDRPALTTPRERIRRYSTSVTCKWAMPPARAWGIAFLLVTPTAGRQLRAVGVTNVVVGA
jgi:hypothetical protein